MPFSLVFLDDQGMSFSQHYSGRRVCAPSCATLMTGKHTDHGQIKDNLELCGFVIMKSMAEYRLTLQF